MINKDLTISVVRGIAIILVVLGHVIQRSLDPIGQDFFLDPVFKIIYTFHMPLFIFISGYVMFFSLKRRALSEAFIARCKSLLVPFIAWSILGVITALFLNVIDGKTVNLKEFPFALANDLFLHPMIWILSTLFISSALLLFSIMLEKRFGIISYFVICLIVLAVPLNDLFSFYYIKWFYLFYLAGYFANRHSIKIMKQPLSGFILFLSLAIFAVLASFWVKGDYIYINKMQFIPGNYFNDFLRLVYRALTAFLGILIIFYIGKSLVKTKIGASLDYIGNYSLDIYLIQRYLVEGLYPRFVQKMQFNFDFNSTPILYLVAFLISLVFVGVCIFISNLLIRKNPLLNKLLLGSRS